MTSAEITHAVETSIAQLSDDDRVVWLRVVSIAKFNIWVSGRGGWWEFEWGVRKYWVECYLTHRSRHPWTIDFSWERSVRCSLETIGPTIVAALRVKLHE